MAVRRVAVRRMGMVRMVRVVRVVRVVVMWGVVVAAPELSMLPLTLNRRSSSRLLVRRVAMRRVAVRSVAVRRVAVRSVGMVRVVRVVRMMWVMTVVKETTVRLASSRIHDRGIQRLILTHLPSRCGGV